VCVHTPHSWWCFDGRARQEVPVVLTCFCSRFKPFDTNDACAEEVLRLPQEKEATQRVTTAGVKGC
jgi:hypothetical protein